MKKYTLDLNRRSYEPKEEKPDPVADNPAFKFADQIIERLQRSHKESAEDCVDVIDIALKRLEGVRKVGCGRRIVELRQLREKYADKKVSD